MYQDNNHKFVCVINGKTPVERALNAMGHATAGLAANMKTGQVEYLDYHNEADKFTAKIAKSPYIVLKSKNGNQLATLRKAAEENDIDVNCFTSSMIGQSAAEQMEQTRVANKDTLDYWCVALFGSEDELRPLTKKFSLYKLKS